MAGNVYWTPHQAAMIANRDGYDTAKWKNILPDERPPWWNTNGRGVALEPFATRWNTEDNDGKLTITLRCPHQKEPIIVL